jgi:hypothetical protein
MLTPVLPQTADPERQDLLDHRDPKVIPGIPVLLDLPVQPVLKDPRVTPGIPDLKA